MTYTAAQKPRAEELALREAALSYPEVTEDFPWDHRAMKVRGKTFAWMGTGEDGKMFFTVKLPTSHAMALMLPFASPTGYGLGKSGWVSAGFEKGDDVPVGLLRDWIDESYRAVAPKTLVKRLAGGGADVVATKAAKKRTTATATATTRTVPKTRNAKKKVAKKKVAKKARAR